MTTILAASVRALLGYCERLDIDTGALLASAGLESHAVSGMDARVPIQASRALWTRAYHLTQDDALGLHVAESIPAGTYGVIHFLCANAPTLGAAFENICAFGQLSNAAFRTTLVQNDTEVAFELAVSDLPSCDERLCAEFSLAACYLGVMRSTGLRFTPARLEIAGDSPPNLREAHRVFGCPVRYESDGHRMWFRRETWMLKVPAANALLLDILKAHAGSLLAALPEAPALVGLVKATIDRHLNEGAPPISRIARELGMSARKLQRDLADLGTSYLRVLDSARLDRARSLLTERDLSLTDIALRLGFSELSAFTRAHKRWTGLPPAKARTLHRPLPRRSGSHAVRSVC